MKILSSLRKRTKNGVSVWNFCFCEETKQLFAVGGENLKVIPATDRKHLRSIYMSFKRYGYNAKLAPKKPVISDPWQSMLPLDMQLQLDAIAA